MPDPSGRPPRGRSPTPGLRLIVAIGALGYAVHPTLVNLAWVLTTYAIVIGYAGAIIDVPRWVVLISPMEHVGRPPLEQPGPVTLGPLTVLALGVAAVAVSVFRGCDLAATDSRSAPRRRGRRAALAP